MQYCQSIQERLLPVVETGRQDKQRLQRLSARQRNL